MIDRRAIVLAALGASACTPLMVQQAGAPGAGFLGPRLEADAFVSFDGTRLGLTRWETSSEPWGVIVGVHGMNDYANAFHMAVEPEPYAHAKRRIREAGFAVRCVRRLPGRAARPRSARAK